MCLSMCWKYVIAGKSGRKRKKDKNSPSQIVESENKIMATFGGFNGTSPMQGQSTPGQFSSHIAPPTFTYTPNMYNSGSPMVAMPQPQPLSPGAFRVGSEQGVMNLILQRLDKMDKKNWGRFIRFSRLSIV